MGIRLPGFFKNALVKLRDANDAPPEIGGDTKDENTLGDGN